MDGLKRPMDQRPRLLLVYADSVYAARCSRFFRRHGWDVHLTANGEEIRQLVDTLAPAALVVDADASRQDAWQTCANITSDHPGLPVVLLSEQPIDQHAQAGTAVLAMRRDGVEGLAQQVFGALV
jgi:DNA-binding response OmpR family regulator